MLTSLANDYGKTLTKNYQLKNVISKNAVIFNSLEYNFHYESWSNIQCNKEYSERTQKIHSHFKSLKPPVFEMQSSNSSDALAMNIFCYPHFKNWHGIEKLFCVKNFNNIEFGFKARVKKLINSQVIEDETEVDVFINGNILCECKLTEAGFTKKTKEEVHNYQMFEKVFHINKLVQSETHYHNYQLIRNILAAEQHNSRFILICDMRRPDLVKKFIHTVNCIKDDYLELRMRCEVIYWQDIAQVVGKDLRNFLNVKYGIV